MPAITLTVPGNKWNDFVKHFCLTHANQTLESDTVLSNEDWVKLRVLLFARGAYEKGVNQVFSDQEKPPIDKDIITL